MHRRRWLWSDPKILFQKLLDHLQGNSTHSLSSQIIYIYFKVIQNGIELTSLCAGVTGVVEGSWGGVDETAVEPATHNIFVWSDPRLLIPTAMFMVALFAAIVKLVLCLKGSEYMLTIGWYYTNVCNFFYEG